MEMNYIYCIVYQWLNNVGYIYISGVCSLEVEHFNHCLIDIVQNLKSVSVNSTHSICRVLGTRVVYVP